MVKDIFSFETVNNQIVTVFKASPDLRMGLSKDGTVTSDGRFVQTEFSNARLYFRNHQFIKHEGDKLFRKRLSDFFDRNGYVVDGDVVAYFYDLLRSKSYEIPENPEKECVWVIIPRPDTGKPKEKYISFENSFRLVSPDMETFEDVILEVKMTVPGKDTTDVVFWADIPKHIYDKCMENTDVTKRPTKTYLTSPTLAGLRTEIIAMSSLAKDVYDDDKDQVNAKKMLFINFSSRETLRNDNMFGAYMGQEITTRFNWAVIYEYKRTGLFSNGTSYFTYKSIVQPGAKIGLRETARVYDNESARIKTFITGRPPGVLVEWTQEREDFLKGLECKFRELSVNLNDFLGGLDDKKLDGIISDGIKFLNA
jgi:hypothetical protein